MRHAVAVVLAIFSLVVVSSAAAAPRPLTDVEHEAAAVALDMWGPPPCPLTLTVGDTGSLAGWADWGAPGEPCLILLSPRNVPARARDGGAWFCAVLAHEWGHLVGQEHNYGAGGLMDVTENWIPPACAAYGRRNRCEALRQRRHRAERHRVRIRLARQYRRSCAGVTHRADR